MSTEDDPVEAARREILLIAYTRLGVPSELSGAFEQAVDAFEAAIRADERDRLKARLEAFVEPFEHARVDGWVPDSVLSELLAVVEEARGGE